MAAAIESLALTRTPFSFHSSSPKLHSFNPPLHTQKPIQLVQSFSNHKQLNLHFSKNFQVPAVTCTTGFFSSVSKDVDSKERKLSVEPIRVLVLVFGWVFFSFVLVCGAAYAASDSISASSFGLKIASTLRGSGWADEVIVLALATLPVLELRGAIPVGYWMQLKPLQITVLSVLGNMVPVPIIVLYLKRFASFLAHRNASASRFLDLLFENARKKAGPIEEFQWLGLMLFVAVPFPGTGAWTGAIIASILDMPFWSALSANFVGVVFAGLLVNLLVILGLKYAIIIGFILAFISTVMWNLLRSIKKSLNSN